MANQTGRVFSVVSTTTYAPPSPVSQQGNLGNFSPTTCMGAGPQAWKLGFYYLLDNGQWGTGVVLLANFGNVNVQQQPTGEYCVNLPTSASGWPIGVPTAATPGFTGGSVLLALPDQIKAGCGF